MTHIDDTQAGPSAREDLEGSGRRIALERRAALRADAAAIGVDEAYIARMVHAFYGRIRADAALGPVFDAAIADRWPAHLERMVAFWSSVALHTGGYSGKPVPAHARLDGLSPELFQRWLALFRETLHETAPSPEAADYFIERADRIAASLQMALFGFPRFTERDAGQREPRPEKASS